MRKVKFRLKVILKKHRSKLYRTECIQHFYVSLNNFYPEGDHLPMEHVAAIYCGQYTYWC